VQKINDAGVKAEASYDENGIFSLKATEGTLSVAGSDQSAIEFLNNFLKLQDSNGQNIQQSMPTVSGKDAIFNLDGMNFTQKSNTFTISGVTYNLKAVGTANLVVAPDNEKAISAVKDFINQYNTLLQAINTELKEPKYSSYTPLTDEQKAEMTDKQIEKWEELARSGMLRNDSILQNLVYKLRSDISTPISGLNGKYTSLSAIGITTGDYTEGGKLYLDENKLKSALEEDPDIVYKLFATSGEDWNSSGVAVRLYDDLKGALDSIRETAGTNSGIDTDTESTLAKQIIDYNKRLDDLQNRLDDLEERYYRQFDALEVAISRLNQQSSWLANMFNNKS